MRTTAVRILMIALAIMLAAGAAAAPKTHHQVELFESSIVGKNVLEPGKYEVAWSGEDDKLAVTFKLVGVGEKVEATGRKIALKKADQDPEVIYGAGKKGDKALPIKEIRFHRRNFAIAFD
jgi:hypothetical protein